MNCVIESIADFRPTLAGRIVSTRSRPTMRTLTFVALLSATTASAQEGSAPTTIAELLKQGWEVAGFTSADANRTSLVLFRHAGVNVLVQCSTHYEVTRTPKTVVNCYELR
jgi:hypothetical protein